MRYILVIGATKIGRELAKELSFENNVVVLDHSYKNLEMLNDDFNGKKILGDVLDIEVLEKAGIKQADCVFALTERDNLNLVLGKVAKNRYKVKKIVIQVDDVIKKKVFREEGVIIVNSNYVIVETLKKCI